MMQQKNIGIIGAGFSSLSAACFLAKSGYRVTVFEKNDQPGGRARLLQADGFSFDMGPSWYWMPDVFETFFAHFGKKPSDFYQLKRLDPSYQVFFENEAPWNMPASMEKLEAFFESVETGAGKKLQDFLNQAKHKYEIGMQDLVRKPGKSLTEFADMRVLKGLVQMNLLQSMSTHLRKYFKDPRLIQLAEFPVLFLGASANKIPALYSLMNYADMALGTWYPMGGMHEIAKAMYQTALELGVTFRLNEAVTGFEFNASQITHIQTEQNKYTLDFVIGGADYHHIEQHLLPKYLRKYNEAYWEKRVMAPSSLLYYVGVKGRIPNLQHHNLFFDANFKKHAAEIYQQKSWPENPLFYACVPSKTDPNVAPEGDENMFLLVPIAAGLKGDDETLRKNYFNVLLNRLEAHTGSEIKSRIVFYKSFAISDFEADYNSFKGNAYGLANTLMQTAILKPSMHHPKIKNLLYCGQLTVPGPGVPPALISGELAAMETIKFFEKNT